MAAGPMFIVPAHAQQEIFPGDSFEAAVESLAPGDTLTVHAGTYTDSGRISVSVKGTAASPVVIQGAPGEARPLITRNAGDAAQNTINVESAEYLTIRGLEISSNGGDGINMNSSPSYITLEDLVIHDISVGVNFRSDMHHITVRGNHIYRTNDTGEGMYVGCNLAACVVSDSLIENNWIHDTLNSEQGDGIEIKRGSHSNVIRNNVIHDTNYPCVLVYGTEGNPRNIIEGNALWNCGNSGIQAAADAVIRNNLILDSPNDGFNSQPHQGVSPGNLEFVHNTLVGGSPCVRLNSWNNQSGLVFANNAVYCASSSFSISGLTGVSVAGNVFEPASGGFPSSGYITGRSEVQDFLNAANRELYPSADSSLIGAGDPAFASSLDFNGTQRTGGVDAGAYAWTGASNPGWAVGPGFKGSTVTAPTIAFSAVPDTVDFQGQSTLSWTTTSATSCAASGAWSGTKPTSGQETVGPLTSTGSYQLACTNASGVSVDENLTITVRQVPATPPTLTMSAAATTIPVNGSTMLTWSTTDAGGCVASNAWSGNKPVSGSESTGALSASAAYTLDCTGPGGAASRTVNVQVQPGGGNDDPADEQASGSGATSGWLLLLLLVSAAARTAGRHRR